jgi:hypothetical protein
MSKGQSIEGGKAFFLTFRVLEFRERYSLVYYIRTSSSRREVVNL